MAGRERKDLSMVCSCVLKSSSEMLSSGEMSDAPCGSRQAALSCMDLDRPSYEHMQACTLANRRLLRREIAASIMSEHDLSLCKITEPATTRICLQLILITADASRLAAPLRSQRKHGCSPLEDSPAKQDDLAALGQLHRHTAG